MIAMQTSPFNVMQAKKDWVPGILQNGQPVAFASKTLSPTERKYAQIEKESLATVIACQRLSQYIFRQENITVQSVHKPL